MNALPNPEISMHPLNLAFRFLLELAALATVGWWGWQAGAGALRWLLAAALPLIAATVWATFNVPEDPSRANKVPVRVPGIVRLALELGLFAFACWALISQGGAQTGWLLTGAVVLHYIISYRRVLWIVRQ